MKKRVLICIIITLTMVVFASATTVFATDGENIPVTGVVLSDNKTDVVLGHKDTITANILPASATNKTLYWSSSNPNVATVDNGVISAKSEGSTVITVVSDDGGYADTCTVNVYPVVDSGTCGENVNWEVGGNGTDYVLVLSGSGATDNYVSPYVPSAENTDEDMGNVINTARPWKDYYSTIKKVIAEDGITDIGTGCFYDLSGMTEIKLSNSVAYIGRLAFGNCSSLISIDLPDNITSIYPYTFDGCTSLEEIKCPEGLTSVGRSAFMGCSSLKDINLPEGITYLFSYTFNGCSSLTDFRIPDTVTDMGMSVFSGCSSLKTINLPDSLTRIKQSSFNNCTSLETISIPENVTTIDDDAFRGCSGLTHIVIPSKVNSIGTDVFLGCTSLKSIAIPDGVTNIGHSQFNKCTEFTTVFYYGDSLNWSGVTIGNSNNYLASATRYNITFNNTELAYTGKAITPVNSITVGNTTLNEGTDYSLSYDNNTNAGTPYVTIEFNGEYAAAGSVSLPFSIKPIESNGIIIGDIEDYTYTGCAIEPSPDVYWNSTQLVEDQDYTVEYSNNINAGRASAKYTFKGNYNGSETKEFTINPVDATNATVDAIEDQDYTGAPITPEIVVSLDGVELTKGADYTVTYANNINVGVAKVFVSFIGNYSRASALQMSFNIDHEWDGGVITKEPSCTEEGEKTFICVTDSSITKKEVVPALGHSWGDEMIVDVPAGCTTEGSQSYHCARCNETKDSTVIPALGHSWNGEMTVDAPATCTTEGSQSYHCTRCSETKDSTVIPATGHEFGEWETIEPSTCEGEGHQKHTCEKCGYSETESLDPKGHEWESTIKVDVPATCITDGSQSYHCKNCEATRGSEVIPATGHDWEDSPTIDVQPTCTEEGFQSIHCSVCGEKTAVEAIPAIGHDWNATTYSWDMNHKSVTATRVCKNYPTHRETETVKTNSKVTKKATYTAMGQTTYTATFTNPAFVAQKKTITNIDKLLKKAQKISIKAPIKKVKAKALKKKAKTIKVITVKNAKGKVSYKLLKGNAKSKKVLKLNKKTGKITVKKKTKKGTYKITVRVNVAGTVAYKPAYKNVVVTVKVK